MDENEVADVDEKPCALAHHKHDIVAEDSIHKQKETSCQGEVPESHGNHTLFVPLRDQPLPEKTQEKAPLAQKANGQEPPI